jgi:excisionase family DNA binding protein
LLAGSSQQSITDIVPNPDDRLVTIAEASALLRMSSRKIFLLLQTGEIPRVKIGRSTRIRLSDAMRIVRSGLQ